MERKLSDMPQGSRVTIAQLHVDKRMLKKLCNLGIYKLQTLVVEGRCAGGFILAGAWGKVAVDGLLAQNVIVRIVKGLEANTRSDERGVCNYISEERQRTSPKSFNYIAT